MPRERIPTHYTLRFKVQAVQEFEELRATGVTRKTFCKDRGIPRSTHQNWERNIAKLRLQATRQPRTDPFVLPAPSRGSKLVLSGSGRTSPTAPIEDDLLMFIKDERRLEHSVSMDTIIEAAAARMPDVMSPKTKDAKISWCQRFMKRNGLTIRRICHSGRQTRDDLEKLRLPFVEEVVELVASHCVFDPRTSLTVSRALFNMDQTSVYWGMGKRTTVEFVGAQTVRSATNGGESYRCTMALTAAANGRIIPPHFVFNGTPGGDVEREVNSYCMGEVATFSVQNNAWFDERVMLEWIEKCWKHVVVEPSVLILDSLSVHKKATIADALACTGTAVVYVPGGCTGVAQPLDVGVMSPVKQHIRRLHTNNPAGRPKQLTAAMRRREIFDRAMEALACITPEPVQNAFHKAGPFLPYGPPNRDAGSDESADRKSVV